MDMRPAANAILQGGPVKSSTSTWTRTQRQIPIACSSRPQEAPMRALTCSHCLICVVSATATGCVEARWQRPRLPSLSAKARSPVLDSHHPARQCGSVYEDHPRVIPEFHFHDAGWRRALHPPGRLVDTNGPYRGNARDAPINLPAPICRNGARCSSGRLGLWRKQLPHQRCGPI